MTTLCSLAIVFFGLMAYQLLPVSDLPNVDFPTIVVNAGLPGASPETMASSVATPLEKQFSTIAGLDSMTSQSLQGSTSVTLQFVLSRNIDAAAQDVQSAITATLAQLPPGMPSPPTFRKVNPADSPILYLSLSSTTMPIAKVDEYAETYLAQRISMVSGVAQVRSTARRSTRSESRSIPGNSRRSVSASTKWRRRSPTPTSICRPAPFTGAIRRSPSQAMGQLTSASAVPAAGSRISQRRTGPDRGYRARARQRAERQDRKLVQRRACGRAGDSAPARDQHR